MLMHMKSSTKVYKIKKPAVADRFLKFRMKGLKVLLQKVLLLLPAC